MDVSSPIAHNFCVVPLGSIKIPPEYLPTQTTMLNSYLEPILFAGYMPYVEILCDDSCTKVLAEFQKGLDGKTKSITHLTFILSPACTYVGISCGPYLRPPEGVPPGPGGAEVAGENPILGSGGGGNA